MKNKRIELLEQYNSTGTNGYNRKAYITRDYIKQMNISLPTEDLPKLELLTFTKQQMKKLFI